MAVHYRSLNDGSLKVQQSTDCVFRKVSDESLAGTKQTYVRLAIVKFLHFFQVLEWYTVKTRN